MNQPLPNLLIHRDEAGRQRTWLLLVVSRGLTVGEFFTQLDRAFAAGVEAVLVVIRKVKKVYVYKSRVDLRIMDYAEVLEGDPVLPGFRLPLAELFPPPDEVTDAP